MRFIDRAYVEHVCEINPHYSVTREVVDGVPFWHIDDFLVRPDDFVHYLKESFPVGSANDWGIDQAPGRRQWIPAIWVRPIEQHILGRFAPNAVLNWATNIYRGDMDSRRQNYLPHNDESNNIFNLWLNHNSMGGTAMYRCKRMGNSHSARSAYGGGYDFFAEYHTRKNTVEPWKVFKGDDDWEMYHVIEMKFNRLSWYEGWNWHAAYIEPEWYTEEDRYSLIGVDYT